MEKFVATIGRRWTFMEHMELPAYRDGLLADASLLAMRSQLLCVTDSREDWVRIVVPMKYWQIRRPPVRTGRRPLRRSMGEGEESMSGAADRGERMIAAQAPCRVSNMPHRA